MTDKAPAYINQGQANFMALIEALSRDPLSLKSITQLTELVPDQTRDQVFRGLKTAESCGWAAQVGDAWRLDAGICRISECVRLAIGDIHARYLEPEKDLHNDKQN